MSIKHVLLKFTTFLALGLFTAVKGFNDDTTDLILELGEQMELSCYARNREELDLITWRKDGHPLSRGLVSTSVESSAVILTILSVDATDVGRYECFSGGEDLTFKLAERYLYVDTDGKELIVPPTEQERVVNVVSKRTALLPCRPTLPDIELSLVRGVSQRPINLGKAGMTFDPKVGFTIDEGKLTQHNGIVLCQAHSPDSEEDKVEDMEHFTLIFSFSPLPPVDVTVGPDDSIYNYPHHAPLAVPSLDEDFNGMWKVGERQDLSCSLTLREAEVSEVSLHWVTPALMLAGMNVVDDEYYLEGGRVTVTRYAEPTGVGTLVNLTSWAEIDPVAQGDQGTYLCKASRGSEQTEVRAKVEVAQQSAPVEWLKDQFNPNMSTVEGTSVRWILGLRANGFHPRIDWYGPTGERIDSDQEWKHSLILQPQEGTADKFKVLCDLRDVGVDDMGQYELWVSDNEDPDRVPLGKIGMVLYVKSAPKVIIVEKQKLEEDILFYAAEENNIHCHIVAYPLKNIAESITFRKCNDAECSTLSDFAGTLNYTVEETDHLSYSKLIIPMAHLVDKHKSGVVTCSACNMKEDAIGCTVEEMPFLLTEMNREYSPIHTTQANDGSGTIHLSCQASSQLFGSLSWWRKERGDSKGDFHLLGSGPGEKDGIEMFEGSTWSTIFSKLSFPNFSPSMNGAYKCVGEPRSTASKAWAMGPWMEGVTYPDSSREKLSARTPTKPTITGASFRNGSTISINPKEKTDLFCNAEGYPSPTLRWMKNGDEVVVGEDEGISVIYDGSGTRLIIGEGANRKTKGTYSCLAQNDLGEDEYFVKVKINKKPKLMKSLVTTGIMMCIGFILFIIVYYRRKVRRAKERLPRKDVEKLIAGDPEALRLLQEENADDDYESSKMMKIKDGDAALLLPYDGERLEFPFDKLSLGSQLGSGHYGRVLKAQARGIVPREELTTVAVKTLKFPAENSALKALMSEVKIMSHLGQHPNLLNVLGACTKRLSHRELYVILEYCHLGNLQQLLTKCRRSFKPGVMTQNKSLGKPITPKFSPGFETPRGIETPPPRYLDIQMDQVNNSPGSRFTFGQDEEDFLTTGDLFTWSLHVAKGMKYLSDKKFLHADLACRNILIAEDGTAKISDFGLARNIYHTNLYKKQSDIPMPWKWLAPECLIDHEFTTASDVWAYGVTLWEIFSLGCVPYPGMEHTQHLAYLSRGERMRCPEYAPGYVHDIMLGCWKYEPKDRLTFDRIVELLVREIRMSAAHTANSLSVGSPPPFFAPDPDSGIGSRSNISRQRENHEYLGMLQESQGNQEESGEPQVGQDGYLISLRQPPPAFGGEARADN